MSFIYKVEFGPNLWEHEYDHVLIGNYEGKVSPNPVEVAEYKWVSMINLRKDIKDNPGRYTAWFKIIIREYFNN